MISYNKACVLSLWQTQILISFLCLSSSHLSLHHYTYTQLSVFGFTWKQEESCPFLCSMYTVFMYVYFLQEAFLFYQSAFFISSLSLSVSVDEVWEITLGQPGSFLLLFIHPSVSLTSACGSWTFLSCAPLLKPKIVYAPSPQFLSDSTQQLGKQLVKQIQAV